MHAYVYDYKRTCKQKELPAVFFPSLPAEKKPQDPPFLFQHVSFLAKVIQQAVALTNPQHARLKTHWAPLTIYNAFLCRQMKIYLVGFGAKLRVTFRSVGRPCPSYAHLSVWRARRESQQTCMHIHAYVLTFILSFFIDVFSCLLCVTHSLQHPFVSSHEDQPRVRGEAPHNFLLWRQAVPFMRAPFRSMGALWKPTNMQLWYFKILWFLLDFGPFVAVFDWLALVFIRFWAVFQPFFNDFRSFFTGFWPVFSRFSMIFFLLIGISPVFSLFF